MLTKFVPYLKFAPYAAIGFFAMLSAMQYGNARHWEKRYIASQKRQSPIMKNALLITALLLTAGCGAKPVKVIPVAPEQAKPPQCPVKLCQEPKRPSFLSAISK
jgi:hypothetical protein